MNNSRKSSAGKRFLLVLLLMLGAGATVSLALYALRSNIDFFYTPRDLVHGKDGVIPQVGQRMQVGGMVKPGSFERDPDSPTTVRFIIYDMDAEVRVQYTGTLPDLFEEGQSVVIKGVLAEGLLIMASEVLAKHDENYTPPEVQDAFNDAMRENHRRPADAYNNSTQP